MVRTFVILFEGRTGSTHVVSSLGSHPAVFAAGELLDPRHGQDRTREADHQEETVRALFSKPRGPEVRVVGFKTKLRDLADPVRVAALLEEFGTRIVILTRKNLVKLALSEINARRLHERTGEYNRIGRDAAELEPEPIAVADFDAVLQHRVGKEEQLRILVRDHLEPLSTPRTTLFYEDLLARPDWFFARLQDFLCLEPRPLHSEVRKNTSDDLRQAIPNYDELRAHYAGTRFGPMFDA